VIHAFLGGNARGRDAEGPGNLWGGREKRIDSEKEKARAVFISKRFLGRPKKTFLKENLT